MDSSLDSSIIEDIFILDSKNEYETTLIKQCFDMVNVFVVAIDLDLNITLINKKGYELLGLRNGKIEGQNFVGHFITKNEQTKVQEFLNTILKSKSKQSKSIKYHLQTTNNETKIIEARSIPIRDKENNVLGILISGEDVTNYVRYQHELQNNLNLYRILAQNIPDINLYLFDEKQRFIIAEGAEMKNNGFESSDFENKHLLEINSKALQKIWAPFFDAVISGKEISSEYKFNSYQYFIRVIPLKNPDNKTFSGIAITQNITDEKRTEQTLKQAKETAEKANRAKSDFLARVSHEIRTPLNAILGFTEQLKQTKLNSKQNDYVKIIDKSSEHLLSLINDILILSKIEARQLNFEKSPFKIKYNVKYVHNALINKAREKGLSFTYNIDPKLDMVLLGDSFRLRQILINMLSNAIKFTSAGYVELRCFLIHQNKNKIKVRFDIIDTGIGIKSENLQRIFEQFKQADSSISQKYGGTGLGLTICKNLIDMQNGSLSVSSQENIGTTFSFVIPYDKGAETDNITEELGEIDPHKLKGKSVLLVDDDSVNRLLGKTILEKIECDYDIASNGKEAIAKLDAKKYDVVLLDIYMPDINGVDVAKYLRQKKNNESTKIVAVTAAVMKDDIEKYYKAGINDFLIKPFKEIHLFNKMCEVLQVKQMTFLKPAAEIILKEEIHPKLYDLSELKIMSGNKPELIAKMLTTFIENSKQALQKFNDALADKDNELIAETAHKILPSYRHLNVNYIVNILIGLRNTCQNSGNFLVVERETKVAIQAILKLVDELLNELKQVQKSD
jgi:PAS domain S-box-containing protein